MRNLLPLLAFFSLLIISCEKENQDIYNTKHAVHTRSISEESPFTHPTAPIGSSIQFKIIDNRVVLEKEDDLAILIWSLEGVPHADWESQYNFSSYLGQFNSPLKEDQDVIKMIVNKDGIIEVTPWIFKLDFNTQDVLVIHKSDKHLLPQLITGNTSDPKIKIYSFEDDVWDNLKQGKNNSAFSPANKRCRELKSKNKRIITTASACICTPIFWQNTSIGVRYNRFGIWETVKAYYYNNYYDVYGQNNNHYTPANLIEGRIHYHFDERCGITDFGTVTLIPGLYSQVTYTLRSNKKPLERNKSVINMIVSTSYDITPAEPMQTLNAILKNF